MAKRQKIYFSCGGLLGLGGINPFRKVEKRMSVKLMMGNDLPLNYINKVQLQ